MPTWDYECRTHGVAEVYVKPSDAGELVRCKLCGEPTQRKFSVPSVVFRGKGWAKKDRSGKGK